ncbi:unnamed protein product, partial [marine sediment metagenome]
TGKYIQCYHALRVFYKDDEEVNALQEKVMELEEKLAEASRNDVQHQVAEQQLIIEDMQKALEAINRRDAERRDWEKLREEG